jgi:hypothetical protein
MNLKKVVPFYKKNGPKKPISCHNIQRNRLARREYRGKIYVKNIRKNSCMILNRIRIRIRNQLESRIRIRIWIRKKSFLIHNTISYSFPCSCLRLLFVILSFFLVLSIFTYIHTIGLLLILVFHPNTVFFKFLFLYCFFSSPYL